MKERDSYIDFLRAFGLVLLVVAHTNAPPWLATTRTFDVPLMVFISAICYKPLRGGVFTYCKKRFKRIYLPVAIFLTLFFTVEGLCYLLLGKPHLSYETVIGSFLLLNSPSIGYVWIMRVFLLMALFMPFLYKMLKASNFITLIIIVVSLVIFQHFIIQGILSIENKLIRFVLDETILYVLGYSTIALIGLKIQSFSQKEVFTIFLVTSISTLITTKLNNWNFDPQAFKYPPQSIYLFYGISISTLLWLVKPIFPSILNSKFLTYLSENSMWIYLWHIIPVYLISPWSHYPNMWFGRFLFVLLSSIILNVIYKAIILKFPLKIYDYLK